MVDFIQSNKALYGVEAICKILPITPSTYYWQLDLIENPEKRSKRDLHDQHYTDQIKRIWQESAGATVFVKSGNSWNKKDILSNAVRSLAWCNSLKYRVYGVVKISEWHV